MRVLALACGWLTGDAGLFLAGETGRMRLPVPSWLIEHPRGRLLFDSGMHPDVQRDPRARLGRLADVFEFSYGPGEDVASRLRALEIDPASIRMLVTSHLHFDHVGGNASLPNARVVVQRREWEAGRDADLVRRNFYDPRDYDLGHDLLLVDGEHDLFGDGSVVCIPTHGHTPGHQSLRVRTGSGELVLTADACYLRRTLEAFQLPGTVFDRDAMLASLQRLRALEAGGARLLFGHDAEQWQTLPRPPLPVA
jgi:glyoxylase-like metal-dependent hydrolase (beta-lactamase superfamily II)